MDLQSPKKVTGIITQGAKDFGSIQFLVSFKVAHSDNGQSWTTVKDKTMGTDKVGQWNPEAETKLRSVEPESRWSSCSHPDENIK